MTTEWEKKLIELSEDLNETIDKGQDKMNIEYYVSLMSKIKYLVGFISILKEHPLPK